MPNTPESPHHTARDAAEWMTSWIKRYKSLEQSTAAQHIAANFGLGFVTDSPSGLRINAPVLREFRRLTKDDVVCVRPRKVWRTRNEGDPPGREAQW
jgi:hypothetical protein